jgi:hypothetical protein
MMKKIKLMHYKSADANEVCIVDYNDLKVKYYDKEGNYRHRLLGAVNDRIEANLSYNGWIKTNAATINKFRDAVQEIQLQES